MRKEIINIVFLDIDGVLNCKTTKDKCGYYVGIELRKVMLLKKIVDSCDAKIVLVSSWKEHWYKAETMKKFQDNLASYLDDRLGRCGLIIYDKTKEGYFNRGREILNYINELKTNNIIVNKYVILDFYGLTRN